MGSYISYYTYMVSKSQRFERYIVGYDTSVDPPTPIYQYDVVKGETTVDGNVLQINIDGLEPNTPYYILLKACNRAGCTYRVLGPIVTWNVGDSTAVMTAQYRQNPLTGMLRIWWECATVPDSTDLHFTGDWIVDTTVERQSYIDGFRLEPGRYDLDIYAYNGTGTDRQLCGRSRIENIIVKQYSVGMFCDYLYGIEGLAYTDQTKDITLSDTFTIADAVDKRRAGYYTIEVCSGFSISDACDFTFISNYVPPEPEKDYVYIEVESLFTIVDAVSRRVASWVFSSIEDTFTVQDEWPSSELGKNNKYSVEWIRPYRRVIIGGSSFGITDRVIEKSQMSIIEVGDSFTIKGELGIRTSDTFTVVDQTSLVDRQEVRDCITVESTQSIDLHDVMYDPVIVESIATDDLEVFDSPLVVAPKRSDVLVDNFEGSEVGQVYDFSHLDKGFG